MLEPILEINDLTVSFKNNNIIKQLSLNLYQGKIYSLIGGNGSGKSTLLRSIIGLHTIDSGSIKLNNKKINNLPINRRVNLGIHLLSQQGNVFPSLNVKDHFELALFGEQSVRDAEIYKWFPELIKLDNRRANTLSGGQQKLLGFAMLLLKRKKQVVLLDEPFAGVDLKTSNKFIEILKHLLNNEKATILMVEQNEKIIQIFNENLIDLKKINKI